MVKNHGKLKITAGKFGTPSYSIYNFKKADGQLKRAFSTQLLYSEYGVDYSASAKPRKKKKIGS